MEFSPTAIVEVLGLALVFFGVFKLDAINKSLGQLGEFAKTATDEIQKLRARTHEHSNEIFYIKLKLDERDKNEQPRQSKQDRRSGS